MALEVGDLLHLIQLPAATSGERSGNGHGLESAGHVAGMNYETGRIDGGEALLIAGPDGRGRGVGGG